jgi:hypothetical protein
MLSASRPIIESTLTHEPTNLLIFTRGTGSGVLTLHLNIVSKTSPHTFNNFS